MFRGTRAWKTAAASILVAAALPLAMPTVVTGVAAGVEGSAMPVPMSPDNPAVATQWANPHIRPGDGANGLTVSLREAPAVVDSGASARVTARVSNNTDETVDGLTLTARRGPISGSVSDARASTIAEAGEYTPVGKAADIDALEPGGAIDVVVDIPVGSQPRTATFPLLLALARDGASEDTERWHMTVRGSADGAPDQLPTTPAGMTVVYPISATVDVVPGETGEAPNSPPLILSSEQLADQLAPGGRLDQLVSVFEEVAEDPSIRSATCLAVDPALLSAVDRMSRGYTVDQDRPAPGEGRRRLRDSWGGEDASAGSTPGRGANDAAAWLDKLRVVSAGGCVTALPWANADLNAVARTGDQWLMREAVERGPFTVERVLGTPVHTNVVIPGAGYITPDSAPGVGWADHSRSTVPTDGMQAAWEAQRAAGARAPGGRVDSPGQSPLDNPNLPGTASVAAPAPEQLVRVLVADNTAGPAQPNRFTGILPGVAAVTYDSGLAATLAATGDKPETPGFSEMNARFDATLDSTLARNLTAATAVRTAAMSNSITGEVIPGTELDPTLVIPPATWEGSTARYVMDTVADLFRQRTAVPMSFEEYTRAPDGLPLIDVSALGSPYADPTVFSDTEILSTAQQASFIDDLTELLANDPAIALTRYGYTLPLRDDLLGALTVGHRRSMGSYNEAERATRSRLNGDRDALAAMRASIALIPPGNVYTRTSASSPLLIVAENGLPLPVDATILYEGPEAAKLNAPAEFRIPARGSITLQMTADLPSDKERTELQLYLATPQNQPISQPVDIAVQTAGGAFNSWILVAGTAGLFAFAVLFQVGKRRREAEARRGDGRGALTELNARGD